MHGNQQLPDSFESHRNWLVNHLQTTRAPEAWICINGQWILQTSHHSNHRIEHLEYIITRQDNIGILRFSAFVNMTNLYTIVYLYDGSVFSHSIFQPMNTSDEPDKQKSRNEEKWWIEPWSIDHLLY